MYHGLQLVVFFLLFGSPQPILADSPLDIVTTAHHRFLIPFRVSEGENRLAKLTLYISSNGGDTWEQIATATPKEKHFLVSVEADGEYWFAVQSQTQDGTIYPMNSSDLLPSLKVRVDTSDKVPPQPIDIGKTKVLGVATEKADAAREMSHRESPRSQLDGISSEMKTLERNLNNLSMNEIRAQLKALRKRLNNVSRDLK